MKTSLLGRDLKGRKLDLPENAIGLEMSRTAEGKSVSYTTTGYFENVR